MKLEMERACDVLVLGSGLAGLSAAVAAAEEGKHVILACKGKLFSGSSFYPGTWGLGLIAPENEEDEADLCESIAEIGCHMTIPEVVETLVKGIHPAIEKLQSYGVVLKEAAEAQQKEYIPCFDHKHRAWHGLVFDNLREAFSAKIQSLSIDVLEHTEALQLVKEHERVIGAFCATAKGQGSLRYLGCGALVMATGGYGALFQHHLCTNDVAGLGQALALQAGCALVNMEFMQIMLGFLRPAPQTIFNEKVYAVTNFNSVTDDSDIFEDLSPVEKQKLLMQRSTHGPFTSRLHDKEVDLAILHENNGVIASYKDEVRKNPPEFVKHYFDWLEREKGLTADDAVFVTPFAHAANGGIAIDSHAFTGIPGLYAAGEVTGGMHGADRIGGLATANALVFGGIAGRSAAESCTVVNPKLLPRSYVYDHMAISKELYVEIASKLKICITLNTFMERCAAKLERALHELENLKELIETKKHPSYEYEEIVSTHQIRLQILTSEALVTAALERNESRGSHYRTDYPKENKLFAHPRFVDYDATSGKIKTRSTF